MSKVKDVIQHLNNYDAKLAQKVVTLYPDEESVIDPCVIVQKMELIDAASVLDILPESRYGMTGFAYKCAKLLSSYLKKPNINTAINKNDWETIDCIISPELPYSQDSQIMLGEIEDKFPEESTEWFFTGVVSSVIQSKHEQPMYPSSIAAAFSVEVLTDIGVPRGKAEEVISGFLKEEVAVAFLFPTESPRTATKRTCGTVL
jgi:hypothetical protein